MDLSHLYSNLTECKKEEANLVDLNRQVYYKFKDKGHFWTEYCKLVGKVYLSFAQVVDGEYAPVVVDIIADSNMLDKTVMLRYIREIQQFIKDNITPLDPKSDGVEFICVVLIGKADKNRMKLVFPYTRIWIGGKYEKFKRKLENMLKVAETKWNIKATSCLVSDQPHVLNGSFDRGIPLEIYKYIDDVNESLECTELEITEIFVPELNTLIKPQEIDPGWYPTILLSVDGVSDKCMHYKDIDDSKDKDIEQKYSNFTDSVIDQIKTQLFTLRNTMFATDKNYTICSLIDEINPANPVAFGFFEDEKTLLEKAQKVLCYCIKDTQWYEYQGGRIISRQNISYLTKLYYHTYDSKNKTVKRTLLELLRKHIYKFNKEEAIFIPYNILFETNPVPQHINYFIGYKVQPVKNSDLVKPWLDHLKVVCCNNSEASFKYSLQWIADIFQNPQNPQRCALFFTGPEGSGKDIPFTALMYILGDMAIKMNDMEKLTSKFTGKLMNRLLVICDEVNPKSKYEADILKSMIADTLNIEYERKGKDPIYMNSYDRFIFTSNHEIPLKIPKGDRHYFSENVNDCYVGNIDYFNKLGKLLIREDFQSALLYYLLCEVDLSDYCGSRPPLTESKQKMIPQNRVEMFLDDLDFDSFTDKNKAGGVSIRSVFEKYKNWKFNHSMHDTITTSNALTNTIKTQLDSKYYIKNGSNNKNYVYRKETPITNNTDTTKLVLINFNT